MNLSELDVGERDIIISDARNILNSKGFEFVLAELKAQCVQELLGCPVGSLTAAAVHARMKALEELKQGFQMVLTEDKLKGNK